MIHDVFLDANVAIRATLLPTYPDYLIFGLAQYGCIRLVFCAHVLVEIERNLIRRWEAHHQGHPPAGPNTFLDRFRVLYNLAYRRRPDTPQTTTAQDALASRIIHHQNDVPVLAAAMRDMPGGILISNNTHDFTPAVARKTTLRIYTPSGFLQTRVRVR